MVSATIFFTFLSAFALSKPLPCRCMRLEMVSLVVIYSVGLLHPTRFFRYGSYWCRVIRLGLWTRCTTSAPPPVPSMVYILPRARYVLQRLINAFHDAISHYLQVETFVAPRPGSVTAVNNWHWPADCPDSVIFHPRRVEGTP